MVIGFQSDRFCLCIPLPRQHFFRPLLCLWPLHWYPFPVGGWILFASSLPSIIKENRGWNNGYVVFKWKTQEIFGGEGGRGRRYSARPRPFLQQTSGQMFKDDVNGLSSFSDICCMPSTCSTLVLDSLTFFLHQFNFHQTYKLTCYFIKIVSCLSFTF